MARATYLRSREERKPYVGVLGPAACALAGLTLVIAFAPRIELGASAGAPGLGARKTPSPEAGFTVTIREEAGISRRAEPVKVSLPFPEGRLREPDACIRGPGGRKFPAQFNVLARWADGSIRWLLARFFVDVPARGKLRLRVTRGESSSAKGKKLAAIGGGTITIDTGPVKAIVGGVAADSFIVTDERGRALLRKRPSLVIYAYTQKPARPGIEEHRCLAPDTVRLEENGPLYASVFVAGPMACEGADSLPDQGLRPPLVQSLPGRGVFRYETRLHFWKGKSQVLAEHTIVNVAGPPVTIVDGAVVELAVPGGLTKCLLGGNGQDHTFSIKASDRLRIMQNCAFWHECIPSYPGPVYVVMEDDRTYAVRRGEDQVAAGEMAPGWLWAADKSRSLGIAVRNFWEEGPKAMRLSGDGGVAVELYAHWVGKPGEPRPKREPIKDWGAMPFAKEWRDLEVKHRDLRQYPRELILAEGRTMIEKFLQLTGWEGPVRRGPIRFGRTRAKTTDVLYLFGSADRREAETRILAARRSCLVPVVDPEYLCSTRALSFVWASASSSNLPQYEQGLTGAFRNWEKYATRYGFLHYGDDLCGFGYNNTEPSSADDQEYDTVRCLLAQFARTGFADYFRRADDCARHYADVDQNQLNGRVRFHGYTWDADYHEEPKSEDMGGHIYVQGMVDHYAFTGDLRSRRCFERVAEALRDYGKDPEKRVLHWDERSISRPGIALCAIYEITHDPRHLAPVKSVVDAVVRHSGDVLKERQGREPFRTWLLYRSELSHHLDELLVHYHNATRDPAALKALLKSLDRQVRDLWDPERQAWRDIVDAPFSRPPTRFPPKPNPNTEYFGMWFAYTARATGDMRYLAPFLDSLEQMGEGWELRAGNRSFAQSHLWSIPFVSLLPADWKARRDEIVQQEVFRAALRQADGLKAAAEGKPIEPEIHGEVLWADSLWGKVLRTRGTSWVSYPAPQDILRFPGTVAFWVKREEPAKFPDVWPATEGEGVRDLLCITAGDSLENALDIMMGPHDRGSPAYLWVRLCDNRGWETVALRTDWRWNDPSARSGFAPGELAGSPRAQSRGDDKWHHIAVVWNRFSLTAYADGEQVARDEKATLPGGGQDRIHIGWRPGNWYGQAAFYNLRLFRTALPPSRVKKLYETDRPK